MSRYRKIWQFAVLFLPMIGYELWDWLRTHWALASQLDALAKPYVFNTALIVGFIAGLAQLAWAFHKTRKLSSFVVQQLAILLAYTLIPLRFGHYLGGWSVFGLVGLGMAGIYLIDIFVGGPLFRAFAEHFAPEVKSRLDHPGVRTAMRHIELAFVMTMMLSNGFVLLGNRLLPKALYLLLLPLHAKVLWGGFMAFAYGYGRWRKKRSMARTDAAQPVPTASL